MSAGPRLAPSLIAITPGDLDERGGASFVERASACVSAGLRAILLREPALSDRATLELSLELRAILGDAGWLAVHDRAHLARAAHADATHLGFRSLPPREARASAGDETAIGFSAHEGDSEAAWDGADYLLFGPVLDTPSKRGWRAPVGFDGLARVVARSSLPVYAVGGLAPDHALSVRASGARAMAVLSGIFLARDPARAVERYIESWSRAAREASPE